MSDKKFMILYFILVFLLGAGVASVRNYTGSFISNNISSKYLTAIVLLMVGAIINKKK